MVDQTPPFEIYHDPPDQDRPSAKPPFQTTQHPTRLVLSEIILPNWGTQTQRGSALKHEILPSQPEPFPQSDILPSASSSEESKENVPSPKPLKASPHKKSRMLSSPGLRCNSPPCTTRTPLSTFVSPSISRLKPIFGGLNKWSGATAAKEPPKP